METKLEAYFFHFESETIFVDNLLNGPIRALKAGVDLIKIGMAFDPSMGEIERRLNKRSDHLQVKYIAQIFEKSTRWYNEESKTFEEVPF